MTGFRLINGKRIELSEEEVAAIEAEVLNNAVEDDEADLNKAQFTYLLRITRLDKVWTKLEEYLETMDLQSYSILGFQRDQTNFRLSVTLQFIEDLTDYIEIVAPDVDLSQETIREKWKLAIKINKETGVIHD